MTCAIVDIGIGNLHSAEKAFVRMAAGRVPVVVTADPDVVARAERVVLPGDGAFPACRRALAGVPGLEEAIRDGARHPTEIAERERSLGGDHRDAVGRARDLLLEEALEAHLGDGLRGLVHASLGAGLIRG